LADPQTEGTATLNSPVEFKGTASWFTRLELVRNNQVVGHLKLSKSKTPTAFSLKTDSNVDTVGFDKYTIRGWYDEEQVLQ
ncbi:hypothetical protein HK102_013102, partial [Quaeritorhiza haematococci]